MGLSFFFWVLIGEEKRVNSKKKQHPHPQPLRLAGGGGSGTEGSELSASIPLVG